jgi:hypothetical protein
VRRRGIAGEVVPGWLTALITILPVLLAFPSFHLLVGFYGNHPQEIPAGVSVLGVYQNSLLRFGVGLLVVLAPVGLLLDVLGDVVFHVVPHRSRFSILATTAARLEAVLLHFAQQERCVTVLAHSQGSIVALEVIRSGKHAVDLVTVGAPVHSLYKRFLGYVEPAAGAYTWTNLWRTGDFIGGPITAGHVNDIPIGAGQHVDYWSDPRVWRYLRQPPGLRIPDAEQVNR